MRNRQRIGWALAFLALTGAILVAIWIKGTSPEPIRLASVTPDLPERSDQIGVSALLREMLDPSLVSRLPEAPYSAYLASSYDRRSVSPEEPETWFANNDWASQSDLNFVRSEKREGREETVLMDVTGAGAIVRIWTATPTGILRIYVDGNQLPSLAEPMERLLGRGGIIPPPLAHVTAKGYNLYFPFPFRKSCIVTVDDLVATDPFLGGPLERFYYQINYRLYDDSEAKRLRSYRPSDLRRAAPLISRAAELWAKNGENDGISSGATGSPLVTYDGEARAEVNQPGGGIIRKIALFLGDAKPEALVTGQLEIRVDDELTVSMPLGDFFGFGERLTPYRSLYFEVRDDGTLISRWPMPFREKASVVVRGSTNPRGTITSMPEAFTERSLLFHAIARPPARVPTRPFRELTFVDVKGRGQYVGSVFRLENPPRLRWWGEGDEKIYVDGGEFPVQFGTGTEDYYGYAWSTPQRFQHSLHGQPRAGTGGFDGSFFMYRFHLLDAVPFQQSLRFDMELWHWDKTEIVWGSTAYYYARPVQP